MELELTRAGGGINFWSVYNTGVALVVDYAEVSSSSTKSTAAPTSAASTSAAEVTVTATQSPSNNSGNSGGGTNVAGVAAGVVVGILVIAGAVGGVFLYLRRKRNREIEEEHRRNAAVNDFFSKPPGSSAGSMTDTRLDPVLVNRRLSDGSIADNQDYSRRILRVGLPVFGIKCSNRLLTAYVRSPTHDRAPQVMTTNDTRPVFHF
jgi:cell wall integrity and stress response component